MTQEELAVKVKVNVSSVISWEKGEHYPRRKLGAIEKALGPLSDQAHPPSSDVTEALDRAQRELDELRRLLRNPGKGDEGDDGRARYAV